MNEWGGLPRHPVEALRNEIDRLSILRDLTLEPPLLALTGLMDELLAEDWQPFNVAWAYHEFASAVVHADAPRVLSDPWRDYLLWAILEREHLFSRKTAAGQGNPVLTGMMSGDLHIMQQLFLLDDAMMRDWCRELMRAEVSDSWAHWSMSMASPVYGNGPLARMRCHLVLSEDWGQLADKLGEYHAQFGCGVFLSSPRLLWNGEELSADPQVSSGHALQELTEGIADVLAGKTAGVWVVAERRAAQAIRMALPAEEITLVRVADGAECGLRLWDRLRAQPGRFIVCLPYDVDADQIEDELPDNAGLIVFARKPPQGYEARSWRIVQGMENPKVGR